MKPSPLENYNLLLKEGSLLPDSTQGELLELIDSLFYQFKAYLKKVRRPLLQRLFFFNSSSNSIEIRDSFAYEPICGVNITLSKLDNGPLYGSLLCTSKQTY